MPAGFTGVCKLLISDDWWSVERNRCSVTFEIFLDSFMQKCEIKKLYWCEAWLCKQHESRWCIDCRSDLLQVNLLTQNSSVSRWTGFDLNSWLRFWQTHQHCDQACSNTYRAVYRSRGLNPWTSIKVATQQVSDEDIHNIRGTMPCQVRRKLATLISCFKRKE